MCLHCMPRLAFPISFGFESATAHDVIHVVSLNLLASVKFVYRKYCHFYAEMIVMTNEYWKQEYHKNLLELES